MPDLLAMCLDITCAHTLICTQSVTCAVPEYYEEPQMTSAQIRKRLRALAAARGSQRALAATMSVTPSYLSDVLAGRREPGPAILTYLGLERAYQRKESERC